MAGKNNQGYRNPFVTTGGTYENPRLGITDFGGFTEEFEGRTKLAVEKHELKKADWRAKYNAGKLSAEELYGGEAIGGTDTENITESGIALEGNQALMDQFKATLEKTKAEFAYYAASGNTVETNKILKDNELYKNAFTGAQAYAAATNDTGVDGTYNAGASDDSFESFEEDQGWAGVEMAAYMVIHNKNKADMKFEKVTNKDGTEVVGTYVDYPQDENGNYLAVADGGKVTKRFIDFSKWNDETYVATKYKANVDIDKNISTTQEKDFPETEFETTKIELKSGDEGYADLVVDGTEVVWGEGGEAGGIKVQTMKTEKVSQKSIDSITSKVNQQTLKVFNRDNSAQFPAIYNTMINTDGYVPGDEDTIPGAVENDIFSFIKDNQFKLNYMTGDQKNAYQDLLIEKNVLDDFDTWSIGKNGLTDIKKRSKYNEYVSGKMDEVNTWFMKDFYKQKSLANTNAFNLNENGRAVAVGSTTIIEEKYEKPVKGPTVNVYNQGDIPSNIYTDPRVMSSMMSVFTADPEGFLGIAGSDFNDPEKMYTQGATLVPFEGIDLTDEATIDKLNNEVLDMLGITGGKFVNRQEAIDMIYRDFIADNAFNSADTPITWETRGQFTNKQKLQIQNTIDEKVGPNTEGVFVKNFGGSETFIPDTRLKSGMTYYGDAVEFYSQFLPKTQAGDKKKIQMTEAYQNSGMFDYDNRLRDHGEISVNEDNKTKYTSQRVTDLKDVMNFYTKDGELELTPQVKRAIDAELTTMNYLRKKKFGSDDYVIGHPANWYDDDYPMPKK